MVVSGLLIVGHSFLAEAYPESGLEVHLMKSQVFLFLLFLSGHILTVFLAKKMDMLYGMAFLGFSVVKFIFAGLLILLLKKMGDAELSKQFILVFMASYFSYLVADVFAIVRRVQKEGENAPGIHPKGA